MRDELRALAEQARSGEDWPGRLARARRRRRQRWAAVSLTAVVVVAVPVVVLAVSPGAQAKSHLTTGSSPSPLPSSVPFDEACPTLPSQHLGADQPPLTDAFICTEEDRPVAGDGIWLVRVVYRVTDGLDDLLSAYSTPDTRDTSSTKTCATVLFSPLVVYLHSAGPTAAVRAPTDACSEPLARASAAFLGLTKVEVWSQKDRRVQTQQSIDTHCSDSYKDIIEMYAEGSSPLHHGSTTPTPMQGTLTVCRYLVSKDQDGDRIGQLTGAGHVDLADLNAALAEVTIDDTCSTTEQTAFALVYGSRGTSIVVALDGCAMYEDNVGYFRATDELRALLK